MGIHQAKVNGSHGAGCIQGYVALENERRHYSKQLYVSRHKMTAEMTKDAVCSMITEVFTEAPAVVIGREGLVEASRLSSQLCSSCARSRGSK